MQDIVNTVGALRETCARWRGKGRRIALVPTMGALHEGHMALIKAAGVAADRVVASIFVNPKQFGPNEDFERYPRDVGHDVELLRAHGADLIYLPEAGDMYPADFQTEVIVRGITADLCGAYRPGHFSGVTTIVMKLFMQVQPDIALFGEKDYQQLLTIRKLVRDLDIPVDVRGVPTVRETPGGLALSSRNAYLSADERRIAEQLPRVLMDIAADLESGALAPQAATRAALDSLSHAGFARVDYVELRDAETLAPVSRLRKPARLLAAVRIGKTRLIDNWPVNVPPPPKAE